MRFSVQVLMQQQSMRLLCLWITYALLASSPVPVSRSCRLMLTSVCQCRLGTWEQSLAFPAETGWLTAGDSCPALRRIAERGTHRFFFLCGKPGPVTRFSGRLHAHQMTDGLMEAGTCLHLAHLWPVGMWTKLLSMLQPIASGG